MDTTENSSQTRLINRPRDLKYSRVAIFLHWAIALLIIYNLLSGFIIWSILEDFLRQKHMNWYFIGLTSHISSGITVLVLTGVRIAWRLMHEPPPYPASMKTWEKHASHFAHFLLYAVMVLMPLTGWMIVSANPPAGSPGAAARASKMAGPPGGGATPQAMITPPAPWASQMGGAPAGALPMGAPPAGGAPQGGPPRGFKAPGIWFVGPPLPPISALADLGYEAEGIKSQQVLHDKIAEWHALGGWIAVFLLLLHVAGALKHQWIDREPTLQRMGLGRKKSDG